jgi:hypothetical protein
MNLVRCRYARMPDGLYMKIKFKQFETRPSQTWAGQGRFIPIYNTLQTQNRIIYLIPNCGN